MNQSAMNPYHSGLMVGSQLGQYRIVRLIGAGGMGAVFLAEHILLHRPAAIKTLLPDRAREPAIVCRFFEEAQAMTAINEPGIVQIFDFGYHVDGTAYIVMEYLEGESLAARIARLGQLPIAQVLRLGRQIAASLEVAHAAGVLHRDLKPGNVFVIRDPEARGGERTKLLDFGVAGVPEACTHVGTPVYMSPEQGRGEAADQRADIYSLGCTLFHAIAGRPPFTCETSDAYIQAHVSQKPQPPSAFRADVPPELDAVIMACLAKDPAERFASMDRLGAALEVMLGRAADAPQPAAPAPEAAWFVDPVDAPTPESTDYEPERRSWLRSAFVVAGVVLALGVAAMVARRMFSGEIAPPARSAAIPPAPEATPPPPETTPPPSEAALSGLAPPEPELANPVTPPPAPPAVERAPQPHVARPAPVRRRAAAAPPRPASSNEDLYETR